MNPPSITADRRMTQRRANDHVHPDYRLSVDHHRFEDRVGKELENLREDIDAIGHRLTLILGGIAVLAFLAPLMSPLIRAWLNIDIPPGQ